MYSFELYALRLKAALVVLSACNSGVGTLRSAEGVMSLSRAFIYAGTPSVVMTGWEVNDQSGAILMELFYQKLASGLTKDRALQQAKIAWLSESNQFKSHPFFWAAYQLHGDTKPLKKGIGYQSLISILLGLLLISVVVVIVRRRGIATFASKL
jgi:CHAT domain-containing protein